ncbi:Aldolase-type TIM barrel [Penicillium atrosanguineum]|uniref:Aldolase-type TIM barrel n=1 Tax=Penicillium atrosanguineum TaxID=1132637 RepID=UPI002393BDEC|nr:Aldolase-type TIM barrel [Penicillium atrosanguineum]KAJ5289847.1 Aldolase-type TIM barrel [Penicillium atrosanguineum]
MSINSMGPTASNTVADSNSPRTSLGDQSEGDHNGEPYSKLIYRALKDADGHRLSLQQIYDWFIKNTSKGRDSTKGWQNSIRHNLSMNKVRPLTPNTSIIPAAGFISNQFHITIHFPPSGDLASPLPTPPFGDAPHYQLGKVFNGLPPGDSLVKQEFDFSKVIGCTSSPLGDNSMFYGVAGPALSYVPLDLDHIGGWYPLSGPDNGLTGPGKL